MHKTGPNNLTALCRMNHREVLRPGGVGGGGWTRVRVDMRRREGLELHFRARINRDKDGLDAVMDKGGEIRVPLH